MSHPVWIPVVGICPLRTAPDHRAELSSQLLLGEPQHLLDDTVSGWVKVRGVIDGYEGWCQAIQLAPVSGDMPEPVGYFSKTVGYANVNGQPMPVFKGTPVYESTLQAGVFRLAFTALPIQAAVADKLTLLVNTAFDYLNAPYLWGGRTFSGIDCSGFAQLSYRQLGIHLRRDAWMQASQGKPIEQLSAANAGDLAFFAEPDGRITHVGILLNDREIIHASGKVRVDDIDVDGIQSRDQKKQTHRLHSIRRVV